MLVYGDRGERTDPRERLQRLADQRAANAGMAPGLERHSNLAALLIDAGRLLQGLADGNFDRTGFDGRTAATDALTEFLVGAGRALCRSWEHHFGRPLDLPEVPIPVGLPRQVDLRDPEGFAHYAVYPEAYAEAARCVRLCAAPRVIGIRSIGTSLAAVVAAALGARSFVTVRPFGDAFDRRIAIRRELERELLAGPAHFLIVDEGPGQSGSSFAAVADWLKARGVPVERIAFLPSHGGAPGLQASAAHQERWSRAQRVVADLGPGLPQLLERWASEVLGPLDGPLVDISAGKWRALVEGDQLQWPAVNPKWERRKYLARADGETWLLKFAGLAEVAERKLEMARALHRAGLAPEPRGLIHGFLVERWHEEARRLSPAAKPLHALAHYLGQRARLFPAADAQGASIAELLEMARRNASLALGEHAASALLRWQRRVASLEQRVVRVLTDNRLDAHEWLRLPGGRLLKSDAVDHCSGHDLIGAQDIAWDVAGAAVEFELGERETAWLAAQVGRSAGRLVDPELLEFLTLAYLAFRLAQFSLAACATDPAESDRLNSRADTYASRLQRMLLESTATATRLESSLG